MKIFKTINTFGPALFVLALFQISAQQSKRMSVDQSGRESFSHLNMQVQELEKFHQTLSPQKYISFFAPLEKAFDQTYSQNIPKTQQGEE